MPSRWSQVETGMHFDEVKRLFGEDMWQQKGFSENTWLVNNEADRSPDHGYMIVFDSAEKVQSKQTFSTAG